MYSDKYAVFQSGKMVKDDHRLARHKLNLNTHVVFILLFILAVIKPTDMQNLNRLIGMGICGFVGLLFVCHFRLRSRRISSWHAYHREILLFAGLLASYLLSSIVNHSRYGDLKTYIVYGSSQPALLILLAMSYLLFRAWERKAFHAWVLVLLSAVNMIAFLQLANPETALPLLEKTVSADANRQTMLELELSQGLKLESLLPGDGASSLKKETVDCLFINGIKFAQIRGAGEPVSLRSCSLDIRIPDSSPGTVLINPFWQPLVFPEKKEKPVVLLGPVSSNGKAQGIAQLTDISTTGAKLRFKGWPSLDQQHKLESAPYFVVEPGVYTGKDGAVLQAGRFSIYHKDEGQTVTFSQAFEQPPAVFLTLQTSNGENAYGIRLNSVDREGFSAHLFEAGSLSTRRGKEIAGYVAVYSSRGADRITIDNRSCELKLKKVILENGNRPRPLITSVFRWHTIYGVVAALCIVYGASMLLSTPRSRRWTPGCSVFIFCAMAGGICSGSRNFMWTLVVGLICIGLLKRVRLKVWLISFLAAVVGFHVMIWYQPQMAAMYGKILPYLTGLHNPGNILLREFIPEVVSEYSVSNRFLVWNRGIFLWQQTPWLGIGPGVFSITSGLNRVHNLHNIYLQVLVDSGIVGFGFFSLLVLQLVIRCYRHAMFPVFVAVLGAFIFENFFDKSIAFVLILAWMMSWSGKWVGSGEPSVNRKTEFLIPVALSVFSCIALGYILSAAYLGINGAHTFRQADVYGHILGFLNFKDFTPFDRFIAGSKQVFDIPLYQILIASLSTLFNADPLVATRFVNAGLWGMSAYLGFRLAQAHGGRFSGLLFVYLFSTAPLVLHYFSVPLPDILAIALSLAGLVCLDNPGDRGVKPLFTAGVWLSIATLIKSPVPFIFIGFYFLNHCLSHHGALRSRALFLKTIFPFIILLSLLLFVAIMAEQLRITMVGGAAGRFAQNAEWYFGRLDLRFSCLFWQTLWIRMDLFGPWKFGIIYCVFLAVSTLFCFNKKQFFLSVAAVVAFFAGWMIFSNLYVVHDYYQLPVAILIQLSFAVSLSHVIDSVLTRVDGRRETQAAGVLVLILVGLSLFQVITQQSLSNRSRKSVYPAIEYALRNEDSLLIVTADKGRWPVTGGLASTKTTSVSPDIFERDCDQFLSAYPAVLAEGFSPCLTAAKNKADYFIEDNNIVFFYRKEGLNKQLINLRNSMPIAKSILDIYLTENEILYYKDGCTQQDVQPPVFLHIIPENAGDLPMGTEYGFQNLDFNFMDHGKFFGSGCLASVRLPSYRIKTIETGQVKSGVRIWGVQVRPLAPKHAEQRGAMEDLLKKLDRNVMIASSRFDVYYLDNTLIYRKPDCSLADISDPFFLHVTPEDKTLLTTDSGSNTKPFINLDFDFRRTGFIFDGEGIAACRLPDIAIESVVTGQYSGKGYVWSVVFKPTVR